MEKLVKEAKLRFIAYGEEVCPNTGSPHYQAYLCAFQDKKASLRQLIKWFGTGHHFAVMRGTLKQNEDYCSKEGRFTKLGDEPRQGVSRDVIDFKLEIETGKRPVEVAEENDFFPIYVRNHVAFQKYHDHIDKKRRIAEGFAPPETYVLIGDPDVGKSKYITDKHGFDVYWWAPDMGKFFDGYCGQSVAVFEDVQKGQIPELSKLKHLLDGNPVSVPIKGGSAVWRPKTIYITSNEHPRDWYDYGQESHYNALMSRVKSAKYIYKDQPAEEFHTSSRFDGVQAPPLDQQGPPLEEGQEGPHSP